MKKWMTWLLAFVLLCGMFTTVWAEPEEEYTQLYISMTIEQYGDGSFDVSLVDDRGGTVSGWPVILEIDGEEVERINTDGYGTASFDYDIPSDAESVAVTSYSGPYDVYYFNGTTEYLTMENNTPSDSQDEETGTTDDVQGQDATTTSPDASAQTTTTVSETAVSTLAVAPMTTAVKGNAVIVGVDVDGGVLSTSQLTQSIISSKATMQMDKALYDSLVSTNNATIHLEMLHNASALTKEILLSAKNANAAFATYEDSTVVGFAVDTGLVYVDGDNRVPLEVADNEFTIAFPVPATMRYSEKIAVAVCTGDGLSALQEVVPSNGVLNFTVQRFQTLAIVGFGNDPVNGVGVQMPWYLIVMIIVGIVLVLGGVALLLFVGLRRRKEDSEDTIVEVEEGVFSSAMMRAPVAPRSEETVTLDTEDDQEEPTAIVKQEPIVQPVEERRVAVAAATVPAKKVSTPLSADDLLNEVMSDLENLDTK